MQALSGRKSKLLFTAASYLQAGNPLSWFGESAPRAAKLGKHQLAAAWSSVTNAVTIKSPCSI